MRKHVLGMLVAAASFGGMAGATPALAADYAPPPAYYPPPPAQSSCCCPTVRRGLWNGFSSCGYHGGYVQYPQYQQPYPEPAYYRPGYGPAVGVGVGGVGIGVGVRYHNPRRHCWRSHGHWVCR